MPQDTPEVPSESSGTSACLRPRVGELCNIWQLQQGEESGLRLQSPMIPCGWGKTPASAVWTERRRKPFQPVSLVTVYIRALSSYPPPFPLGARGRGVESSEEQSHVQVATAGNQAHCFCCTTAGSQTCGRSVEIKTLGPCALWTCWVLQVRHTLSSYPTQWGQPAQGVCL